jgi:hypothetical protein
MVFIRCTESTDEFSFLAKIIMSLRIFHSKNNYYVDRSIIALGLGMDNNLDLIIILCRIS